MKKVLGLCTGSLQKCFGNDLIKLTSFCEKNNIYNIEITLGKKEEINNLIFSPEVISFLNKCPFKSLHFPFKERVNQENKAVLEAVYSIYSKYKFNHITIHPNMIDDISLLDIKKYNISFENVKPIRNFDSDKIKQILKNNKHLGFVLDTSHAFDYNNEKIKELLSLFRERCTLIHMSDLNHNLITTSPTKRKEIMIDLIQEVDVPIFIEIHVSTEKDVTTEIIHLRKHFT